MLGVEALGAQSLGTDPAEDALLMSAFNFCDPFDHVLPPSDATISSLDMQHLWGMYAGIAAAAPATGFFVRRYYDQFLGSR